MSHLNRVHAVAHLCATAGLALGVAGVTGCATANAGDPDGGKPVIGGDASVEGRADAAVQGIRPDAGSSVPADAAVAPPDASADCTTGPVNLLSNADFDQGLAPWVENSGGGFDLITDQAALAGVDADSGSFLAWLGGYSPLGGDVDTFHQDFLLPADATPMSVNGMIWIDSAETLDLAFDTLDLEIVNVASGVSLETVKSWSNLDKGTGWVPFSANITGDYAGQTLRFRLTAEVDSSNNTSFLLDTLSLNTTTCQ